MWALRVAVAKKSTLTSSKMESPAETWGQGRVRGMHPGLVGHVHRGRCVACVGCRCGVGRDTPFSCHLNRFDPGPGISAHRAGSTGAAAPPSRPDEGEGEGEGPRSTSAALLMRSKLPMSGSSSSPATGTGTVLLPDTALTSSAQQEGSRVSTRGVCFRLRCVGPSGSS